MKLIKLYRLRIFYLLVMFLSGGAPTFAALDLELNQGVRGAIPMAIPTFLIEQNVSLPDIAQRVSHDLQLSGRFSLLTDEEMGHYPHQLSEIDFNYWQQKKIDYLLMGTEEKLSSGKLKVAATLVNIYKPNERTIFNKVFLSDLKAADTIAHQISDLIYKELTGEDGFFSTKLAYIISRHTAGMPVQYRLEISDFDGQAPFSLITSNKPLMSPAWSPDGQHLAYVSFENRKAEIYEINIATGKRNLLTSIPGINGAPAWSPDGKKLALVLSKDGSPNIYLYDRITKDLERVTDTAAIDTEPSWTPDGQAILFTSNRGGGPQIYKIDLKSKHVERLTYEGNYNVTPSVSKDNKTLLYLHKEGNNFNIALQDIETGFVRYLTQAGHNQSPRFAPNDKFVIYIKHLKDKNRLSIISTDGQVQLSLPAREGEVQEAVWQARHF